MRLQTEDLCRRYGTGETAVTALSGVSLTVEPGTFVAIAGPSGSGKSTLLNILGLLDTGFEGQATWDGRSTATLSTSDAAAFRLTRIGFVFQTAHLLAGLSVVENVALPHWRLHGNRRAAEARAQEQLVQVGLRDRAQRAVATLSAGEAQRVALARALINEPAVILADEPTGSLDEENAALVTEILRRTWRNGHTVLVATHNRALIDAAERTVRLQHGHTER